MKTLTISINPIHCTKSQFRRIFLFNFPPLSRENSIKFLHLAHAKPPCIPRYPKLSAIEASDAAHHYGGWDDLRLAGDGVESGESTRLRDFLVSIGIDDKRHVFMFLLGVVCAFAVSRIRVWSIMLFPATAVVFAVGFSFGFVRGGSFNEFSVNASKRREKEESFRVYNERLRSLVGFFDGLDDKFDDLKNDIQIAIDTQEVALGDLEKYVNVIKSIKLTALDARNDVRAIVDCMGNNNSMPVDNQKTSSRKKKEIGEAGFEFWKFFGSLFGQESANSKLNKAKQKANINQGTIEELGNDQIQRNNSIPAIENKVLDAVGNDKRNEKYVSSQDLLDKSYLDWDRERRLRIFSEHAKINSSGIGGSAKRFINSGEYSYERSKLRLVNTDHIPWNMDQNHATERRKSHDNLIDSVDSGVSLKNMETEASFIQQQMFESKTYRSSYSGKMNGDEIYTSQFMKEMENDHFPLADYQSVLEGEVGSPSSAVSDDVVFDRYLTEANNLLKLAKECIRGRHDGDHADVVLCKSTTLLCRAVAMKPMSLLAVGQLGNAYLLHGELKLKISRELRNILSRRDPSPVTSQGRILKGLDYRVMSKDRVASILVNACEECEELLVEAGRKYRLALSIDGSDMRALYNWGLALFFRAQLIADIGPEASFDADRVFLAAIDKFDAMLSKGNVYAPDALFRWGVALQQRSHLRRSNSKEKVKLLQQAQRLYEDALEMDSDNLQVREALSTCVSELNQIFF